MKGKYIIYGLLVLVFIGYINYLSGWYDLNFFSGTKSKYVNKVNVSPKIYEADKQGLLDSLYSFIRTHTKSFSNPEYFHSTILSVDSILYDSSLQKIALFVVAKNPTSRNKYSDSKLPYYYNANCYLGKRIITDSSFFELHNIGPMTFINFDEYEDIAKAIRRGYFKELKTFKAGDNSRLYDYNLDDERFWNSKKGFLNVFPN